MSSRLHKAIIVAVCACMTSLLTPVASAELMRQSNGTLMPSIESSVSIPVDGSWFVLEELMDPGWFYSPIFTFNTALPQVQIDVTDLFVVSDRNELWFGLPPSSTLIGATPPVLDWSSLPSPPSGPFVDPPFTTDPDVAWSRAEFSKASFTVTLSGSGPYYFRMKNIYIPPQANNTPFESGTVAFRIVPEPTTGALLFFAAAFAARRRRGARAGLGVALGLAAAIGVFAIGTAAMAAPPATVTAPEAAQQAGGGERGSCSGTCGVINASVGSGILDISWASASSNESLRVLKNGTLIELYVPASSGSPCETFDSASGTCPFTQIKVQAGSGDDQIIFDDSGGVIAQSFQLDIDGGDGTDLIVGSAPLTSVPLATLIADLNQFRQDVETQVPESRIESLIDDGANLLDGMNTNLIQPGLQCAQNVRPTMIDPMRQIVRNTVEQEILSWVNFVANDAQALQAQANAVKTDIDANIIDISDVMIPMAWNLVAAGDLLYAHASQLGNSTQSGNPELFINTIENYIVTIQFWADQCNDPNQPPNDPDAGNEDAQLPSGLPYPCDELERTIEQLESLIDTIESRNDAVEAEGDALEMGADADAGGAGSLEGVGNTMEANADNSETNIDGMETSGDMFEADAEQRAANEEAWGATQETTLTNAGDQLEQCLQGVLNNSATFESSAAGFQATAEAIVTDVENLMAQPTIALLLSDPVLANTPDRGTPCSIGTNHTISGGPGPDIIVGTFGNDRLSGGGGTDLLIGGPGEDILEGGDGRDLLFGGGDDNNLYGETDSAAGDDSDLLVGGNDSDCLYGGGGRDLLIARGGDDRLYGQDQIDLLFGGGSNDLLFGGAGETRTVLALKFDLGNLFFGEGGDDTIVGGDENLSDPNAPNLLPGIDIAFGMDGDDKILVGDGGDMTTTASQPPCPFPIKLGNLVFGGVGVDEIVAKDGIDVLFGGDDGDTITAGKGHVFTFDCNNNSTPELKIAFGDLIFGRNGADTINGDDPDGDRADDDIDLLFGGAGNDEINGFDGGKIEVDADEDTTNDFEMRLGNLVFGSEGEDVITTGKGIDLIFGGPDNDTIEAGYGDRLKFGDSVVIDFGDLIFGQGGADTIHGDAATPAATMDPDEGEVDGIDLIFGGPDNDTIYSCDGGLFAVGDIDDPSSLQLAFTFGNIVFGGDGGDIIRAKYENPSTSGGDDDVRPGIDLIFGNDGNDEIIGGDGSLIYISPLATPTLIPFGNMLFGGPGLDTIRGADGAPVPDVLPVDPNNIPLPDGTLSDYLDAMDLIFGGRDNDDIESYDGIDFVFGNDGDDRIVAENGGVVVIAGVPIPFGNLIFGSDGEDNISSLGRVILLEADLIFGGPCDDTISAGAGLLNLVFGGRHDDTITAAGDVLTVNLLFGNRGNDTISTTGIGINLLFGNRGNDTITAGSGVNVAFGNRDDDTVTGGTGLNILFGNRGRDTVNAGNDTAGLYLLFGNRGGDTVQGGTGLNLEFGNACDDVVRGGAGVNLLFGNIGDDQVEGGSGLTLAFGNRDRDRLSAGSGLTLQFGNRDDDRLVMGSGLGIAFGNRGNDIICGGSGKAIAFGNAGEDVITGGTDLNILFGNADNDWIAGGSNATDIIFGNRGNDTIFGRGGPRDLLFGNADNDQINGEDGKDYIFGNRGEDDLESGGGGGDFLFGNRGNDRVYSGPDGSGGDYLFGNRGNDTVDGHPGNCDDKRYGGRGNNTKSCNGNAHTFNQPNPKHGIIRGIVRLDQNGDNIGEVGHGGVTVTLNGNSLSLSTVSFVADPDCPQDLGSFSFTGLTPGTYTICQIPPAGYTAIDPPSGCRTVTVDGTCGGGLVTGVDFVNRGDCGPTPNGFGCAGTSCTTQPGQSAQCRPTRIRRVMRCSTTGEICTPDTDCPCGDTCVPSWAVEQCECVPDGSCYIEFNAANEPTCAGVCNDGTPCQLVNNGDVYYCQCSCGTELAEFRFGGEVAAVQGCLPVPIDTGAPWEVRFRFSRFSTDQDPDPQVGSYQILNYELRLNNILVAAGAPAGPAFITVRNDVGGLNGMQDEYRVQIPSAIAPGAVFGMRLVDSTSAITSDALPLCNDLLLASFNGCCGGPVLPVCGPCGTDLMLAEPCRCFEFRTPVPQCPGFRIRGGVSFHDCTNCASLLLRGCPGDLDLSGTVDAEDVPLFVAELLTAPPAGPGSRSDLDGSGTINGSDIQTFVDRVITHEPCR